jgi:hypothetical protein
MGPVALIGGALVLKELLDKARSSPVAPPAPPPPQRSSAGAGGLTPVENSLVNAGIGVATTLTGALITAGVAKLTAASVAGGTAAGSSAGGSTAATAGTAAAEVAGESSVGLVVAEAAILVVIAIIILVTVATLATTEEHNAAVERRANLGITGLNQWAWSRINAIETALMVQMIQASGGSVQMPPNYEYELLDPRYAQREITEVHGIDNERLAAIVCVARFAAVEQTRQWVSGVREAVKWDLMHSDNWGGKVLGDADIEALGWGMSDAHFQAAVDQYYLERNPTSFGLTVSADPNRIAAILASMPFGTVLPAWVNKRNWNDDNTALANLGMPTPSRRGVVDQVTTLLATHRFIGRVSAVKFMLETYQPFSGVHEPFTAFDEQFAAEYGDRTAYAAGIRGKYGWLNSGLIPQGPFLVDVAARQAFDPSLMAHTGNAITFPLDPRTDVAIVDAAHPSAPL